ncbi:MAG TPA: diacylglycerol kinase family protein [Gemmatimonadales bacterium]|nr:diacylglycerol kinase family protein [Gemmatimonadales bacterium]
MDVTLLVNTSAGEGDHTRGGLRRLLEAAGHRVALGRRKGKGLRRALENPGDLVVAAGGDGTVGRVMKALAGRAVPLAILPLGTANNIATSLGVRGSPEELVARWPDAGRRRVEVGTVRGPWGETRFIESVGLGLLARMMSPSVDHGIQDVEDARARLDRLVRTLPLTRWRLELDGEDLSGDYLLVEAMNVRCAGPNLCVPRADPADGRLEIVAAGEEDRPALRALGTGAAALGSVLLPRAGRRLTMWCKRKELHVDHTYGKDLRAPRGPMRVDVELSGLAVEVLV